MYSKLLVITALTIFISSCSSNSKKIQDKWWYEVEEIGDDIIKFTVDNKIQNINDREVLSYEVNGEEIKMKIRDYEKESGLEMKNLELAISDNSSDVNDLPQESEKIYKEETWTIASITDNELVLKNGDKSKTYRLANDQDFFIGRWEGKKDGNDMKLRFTKKNEVKLKVKKSGERKFTYSFNDKKVVIGIDSCEFTLSEDKNNLIIKGKESLNLNRRGF